MGLAVRVVPRAIELSIIPSRCRVTGNLCSETVQAVITRVLATTGFVSGDFDIDDAPPGIARLEETLTLPLALVEDSWVVVVVSGTDGSCEPMFPVYAADLDDEFNTTLADLLDGNLGEDGAMALGFTNALFVDLGGDGWKGPLEP